MPIDIEKKALEIKSKLKKHHNLLKQAVASHSVVLLIGHEHEKELRLFDEIKKELETELPVFMVKHASEDGTCVNDFTAEETTIEDADTIVMVDGIAPGLVSESSIICKREDYQDKTILFVDENATSFEDIVDITKHYLWYPKIIFYKNREDLIKKIIGFVKKTAYRKANLSLEKLKKDINPDGTNIKEGVI